jgi:hypothetical protein
MSSATATVNAMTPGQTQVLPFFVQNSGTGIDGLLSGSISNVVNVEGECLAPEKDAKDDCATGKGVGEFGDAVTVQIGYAAAADKTACTESTTPNGGFKTLPTRNVTSIWPLRWTDGVLRESAFPSLPPTVVSKDQGACVLVSIQLPTSANNTVQGDSATFKVNVNLEQDLRRS